MVAYNSQRLSAQELKTCYVTSLALISGIVLYLSILMVACNSQRMFAQELKLKLGKASWYVI